MTATPAESSFRCDCHLKHESVLKRHEKDLDENARDHDSLWQAIETRVTNKFFIILVLLVVGGLAFQWANYEKLKTIETNVAVIETKVDLHMQSNALPKTNRTDDKTKY